MLVATSHLLSFLTNNLQKVTVFTTRANTLFGVTYLTLAPEHPLVSLVITPDQKTEVDSYVTTTASRSDLDRTASKEKTGVFTGGYAIHPLTNEKVPIWISDYVLGSYGTGAVMAVPAHDERDFEFASKFGLDVKWVVGPAVDGSTGTSDNGEETPTDVAFTDYGGNTNSGENVWKTLCLIQY